MKRHVLLLLPMLAVSFASFEAGASTEIEARIKRIESGLLPPVLVKGDAETRFPTLTERMQATQTPGVSIAVINDGKIEWARGFGVTALGGPPVTPETLFQAASISKPVSAVSVMQLVERGKLDLDTDVNKYLKRWQLPASEFTAQQKVTLRGLLTHSAGTTVHGFLGYAAGERVPDLVQILDGVPPANNAAIRVDKTPGQSSRYSGGGYQVMQLVMEDTTGRDFADYMRQHVLEPLGMKQSTFQQPLPEKLLARVATPYRVDGTPVVGGPHVYPELAAAGLWTTPSDLARFAIGLQRAWAGARKAILSGATVREMMTPVMEEQGLGPAVGGTAPHVYFMHGGANAGYRCLLVSYVDGDGFVVMTNSDRGGELTGEILRSVAREYNWPDFAPPERVLSKVDPATFDRYVGVYRLSSKYVVSVWREGDRMYSHVPGAEIKELFPSSEREYFQKVAATRFEFIPEAEANAPALFVHEKKGPRPATRLSAAEGQPYLDGSLALARRLRDQLPAAQSEAMLRKLIAGLAAGTPPYDDMSPELAELTRQQLNFLQKDLAALGAIRSVTFKEVSPSGVDVYVVEFDKVRLLAEVRLRADGRVDAAWINL